MHYRDDRNVKCSFPPLPTGSSLEEQWSEDHQVDVDVSLESSLQPGSGSGSGTEN